MRRFMTRLLVALLILGALVGTGAYLYLRRSLPRVSGTVAVQGISGEIDIIRDQDDVPHIFASTRHDALFGLGYVHAQDRLWQMEFQRRIGQGRLSEIFGDATIKEDRFLRTVGFGRAAKAAWDNLPDAGREEINAYVGGVNAFIATHHRGELPPEFLLLRFQPEPWTGPDVLVWGKMMAWDLSANYSFELERHDIARLGPERLGDLFLPYPATGLTILGPPTDAGSRVGPTLKTSEVSAAVGPTFRSGDMKPGDQRTSWSDAWARSFATSPSFARDLILGGGALEGLGSNNWVVDGTRTASGAPLLANDPHLQAHIPSIWYLAHMTAGDFDVAGATLPGTPAVAIGRNRFIAWGETNAFADVQDLYREHIDDTGKNVEFRGSFEPLKIIPETIAVKGKDPVRLDVRVSRHGPIVSDAVNANNGVAPGAEAALEPLALHWTALYDHDTTVPAFVRLNQARNWTEFTNALRDFVVPAQNFVYADVEGHIGYYAPGAVPLRMSGDGLMPAEGWTGEMEWSGWVPFEDLPHAYDPPSHFIVTANNRPFAGPSKYALGFEYHEPFRAQRITDLLQQKDRLTPDDFRTIQSDTFSLVGQTLLPLLLRHAHPETDIDRKALDIVSHWDFNASAESAGAAIFQAWFLRLAPTIIGDELSGAELRAYERHFTFITRFVEQLLGSRPDGAATRAAAWCDDIHTEKKETCDDAISAAFHAGVYSLTPLLGDHLDKWRWDDVHTAVFPHQGLDSVPVLHWLLSRSLPNRGDWSTVNVGAVDVNAPFEQHEVSGYRQILDLSRANDNRFLDAVGQSGHFLSDHYDDALTNWHDVRHRPMRLDRQEIEKGAIGRLTLVPKSE